jgi:RND family efflux transporter MFP subunit
MLPDEPGRVTGGVSSALTELPLCENLAQLSAWVARWTARATGAELALVWTPDPTHPLLVCTGGAGEGAREFARRSIGRDEPVARDLLREKTPLLLARSDLESRAGTWLTDAPPGAAWCLLLPASGEAAPVAILSLFFAARPRTEAVVERLEDLLRHATPALERALRAERRTAGMRQAIERLTALYDLSKAFGSTIEWAELNRIIARKAVDFAGAEAGSLWLLDPDADTVELAASAINENYDVQNPPASVGGALVGDVLADRSALRRNRIPPEDPLAAGEPGHPVRSLLAVPLTEEDNPIGALVVVNKRGRVPEFSEEDQELLEDLARQAVRALRNARRYEAEKKVEELDALLAVSREITATLDLDRVMQTVVNASAALIRYDRCAIAIQERGRLRVGAVSGLAEFDRKSPEIQRMEELLQWVFLSGSDVNVTEREDGTLAADRPETEEKFRALFRDTGLKAFYAVLLRDEEGKLGVLAFECREPIVFDAETRDLLAILVNQATVAVRNAQLYQQVPLVGFWKPLLERRRRLREIPGGRRLTWGVGILVAALVLFLVPWRLRVGGPARVAPGRRAVVTAGVDGIITSVLHREGDVVPKDEVIATLNDETYQSALADAQAAYAIAESEVSKQRAAGNAPALFEAQSHVDELKARIGMEQQALNFTRLRAPAAGVIVTPRLEERVGQNLSRGTEFCVVADVGTVSVEVAVAEEDSSLVAPGQPVDVKLNSYPTRGFHGAVTRVGARIREEGKDRFVIAEVSVGNSDAVLKTGMLGKAKIRAGHRKIITLLLRKPARWLYGKLWPLLP